MISQDEARTRVARGAAHLDQVRPGWFDRIDIGTLTLHDPCGCIVGQLCGVDGSGFYDSIRDALFLPEIGAQYEHGFELRTGEGDEHVAGDSLDAARQRIYRPLQDAWIEAIADRRLRIDIQDPAPVLAEIQQ